MGYYYKEYRQRYKWPTTKESAVSTYLQIQRDILGKVVLLKGSLYHRTFPVDSYSDAISFIKDYRKLLVDLEKEFGKEYLEAEAASLSAAEKSSKNEQFPSNGRHLQDEDKRYGYPSVVKAKEDFLKRFYGLSKIRQISIKHDMDWPMLKQIMATAEIADRELPPWDKDELVQALGGKSKHNP